MILYRVQNKANLGSLWYNPDGTPNRIVDSLTSPRLAQLPMDYDPRYRAGGKIWQCAAWNLEHLYQWFTLQDLKELIDKGYVVHRFAAHEWIKEENQVIFTQESVLWRDDLTKIIVNNLQYPDF